MVLYDVRKQYKQLVNEENMNNHHSIVKLLTLIVEIFDMKRCFEKIDVDKAKALLNEKKTADLGRFYFWRREKFLSLVNRELTNLGSPNAITTKFKTYISCSLLLQKYIKK